MTDRSAAPTCVNQQMDEHRHICAFFNSEDERVDTLLPFVKEGLLRGEKAFYIVDPANRQFYVNRLKREVIGVDEAMSKGQLEVFTWQATPT